MRIEEVKYNVPEKVMDNIYISLLDAYERLKNGKSNIKRCLNWFEDEFQFKPPKGYVEKRMAEGGKGK